MTETGRSGAGARRRRRMALAAALGPLAAVPLCCGHIDHQARPTGSSSDPAGSATPSPPPVISGDRETVLAQVRRIDPCALYGEAPRFGDAPIVVIGPTSMANSCEARIAHAKRDVSVSVSLQVGTPGSPPDDPWIKHRVIDGVDVTSASAFDAPNAPPRAQVVEAGCSVVAHYAGDVKLMVQASAPPDVDGCAVGDQILRTAMAQYPRRPERDATAVGVTVLTGRDPCEVAERLRATHRVTVDPVDASVVSCGLHVDDRPLIVVSYESRDPALARYDPDQSRIDEHPVSGDAATGVYDVGVGKDYTIDGKPRRPMVSVVGDPVDGNLIRETLTAVAGIY